MTAAQGSASYVFAYAVGMLAQQRFGLGFLLRTFTDWVNQPAVQAELEAWIDSEAEGSAFYKDNIAASAQDYVGIMAIPEAHTYHGSELIADTGMILAVIATMPPEHRLQDQLRGVAMNGSAQVSALQGLAGEANRRSAPLGGVLDQGLTFDTVVINLAVAVLQGRTFATGVEEIARLRDENPVLAFNTRGRWGGGDLADVAEVMQRHLPAMAAQEIAHAELMDVLVQTGAAVGELHASTTGLDYYEAVYQGLW